MWCPHENGQLQSWVSLLTVLHPWRATPNLSDPSMLPGRTLSGWKQWIRRADVTSMCNSTISKQILGARNGFHSEHAGCVWWVYDAHNKGSQGATQVCVLRPTSHIHLQQSSDELCRSSILHLLGGFKSTTARLKMNGMLLLFNRCVIRCSQPENGPCRLEKPLLGVFEVGGGSYLQSGHPARLLNKLPVEVFVYFHVCVRETPWTFHSTHEVAQWTGHTQWKWRSSDQIFNISGRSFVLSRLMKALCCALKREGRTTGLEGIFQLTEAGFAEECYAWLLEFGLTAAAQEDIPTYRVGVTTHRDCCISSACFIRFIMNPSQHLKVKIKAWGGVQQCSVKTF